jgi:DNA polymerase-3 subunit delta
LIIECEKLPKNRVIGKALAANSLVVPCPILSRSGDVATWLQMAAKETGKRLEAGVSDILFTAHGGQLGKLHGELQKLSIYVGQKETIQSEDVEAFLSGSVEFDVFGLTNSIEARDLGGALGFAKRICMQGTRDADGKKSDGQASAHRTLSMLASTIEGILGARVAMGQGASREDVASAVGTTPWRAERLMAAAGRYSIADLRRIVRTLAEEMRSTHDTGGDISFSLEKCVIACCHRQ